MSDPLPAPSSFRLPLAQRVALAIALAAGAVLRWINLDAESLWFDEGFTWFLATLAPSQMWQNLSKDVQTPGYFFILHYWLKAFGDSAYAMRSFSAVCSTLTMLLMLPIAWRVFGRQWAAVLVVAMVAFSPLQIIHAREARYYALPTLLIAIALLSVLSNTDRRRRWKPLLAGVCLSGALWCHNMMLLYLPAFALAWWWIDRRTWPRWLPDASICFAAAIVLWLPWVPVLLQQIEWSTGRFWATVPTSQDVALTLAMLVGIDGYAVNTAQWAAAMSSPLPAIFDYAHQWAWLAVVLLGVVAALSVIRRDARPMALAMLALLLVAPIISYIRSLTSQPVFMTRTFIPSTLAAALLVAIPIAVFRKRMQWMAIGVVSLLLLGSIVSSVYHVRYFRHEDWRGAHEIVDRLPREGTLLLFVANEGEATFNFYESRTRLNPRFERIGLPSGYFTTTPVEPVRRVMTEEDLQLLRERLQTDPPRRIALIYSHESFSDPDRLTERMLDESMERLISHTLHHVTVIVYGRR